jgi:hypothetical protein
MRWNNQSNKSDGLIVIFISLWSDTVFLAKKLEELLLDDAGYNLRCTWLRETMRSAVDLDEFGAGRYQLDGSLHFVDSTERVLGSADEKRRRSQLRKVGGTQLGRLSWGMERVGEQLQTLDQTRVRRE